MSETLQKLDEVKQIMSVADLLISPAPYLQRREYEVLTVPTEKQKQLHDALIDVALKIAKDM